MALRRYSTSRGRKVTLAEALTERFAISPVGYWYLLNLAPRIDRAVIPRTDGHWSSAGRDKVGLVTTVGARSGQERTQPLSCIEYDEGSILVIGSNYGREPHPAWSHNLLANPECTIQFKGTTSRCRARLLEGEERERAWAHTIDWYRGYEAYERKCQPRVIRVFRLDPI